LRHAWRLQFLAFTTFPENRPMKNAENQVSIHSNEPNLIPKVIEFIQSATYQEKEKLLQKYPELLGQEADNILGQIELIWKNRGDEAAYRSIGAWREFLHRVAASDFELAMLESIVNRVFVELPDDSIGDYLARLTELHPELLRERADEAVRSLKTRLVADENEDSVVAKVMDAIQDAIRKQRDQQAILKKAQEKMQAQRKKKWSVSDIVD
jgi:hypothetical protein